MMGLLNLQKSAWTEIPHHFLGLLCMGSMTAGWSSYLTLHSKESNLASDGSEKINLNEEDLEDLFKSLSSALGEAQATYIVGYRLYGLYEGENAPEPGVDILPPSR